MKRRDFIRNSSLLAFSVSAFSFTKWNGEKYVGDSPTTSDILGPFYRPNAPMRTNIIPADSKGLPLNLK
ncbi:MAG: catechol 1,2-dioxygenase, partial [Arcticibacterium sp.]